MNYFLRTLLFFIIGCSSLSAINPKRVVVIYNTADPDSYDIAKKYIEFRKIPESNLVGLKTSTEIKITRKDYNKTIKEPLNEIFKKKGWWGAIATDAQGNSLPTYSKIDLLVSIRGIPLMIQPPPADPEKPIKYTDVPLREEAAVDSELTLLGVNGYPTLGALNNGYFQKDISFREAEIKGTILTGRIDAPTPAICLRMMRDAYLTEKSGLWGMCYIDQANKFPQGDQWLQKIYQRNQEIGIPTLLDKNRDTFLPNYPMQHAALYFGWYSHHRNGPFLNPRFRLKAGSIAVHIHSFSGQGTRRTNAFWTGSILSHGAAVTCANMYEPGLGATHYLDIFYDRLLKGYTVAEAASMACPAISWQATVIGDPLYRPFKITSAAEGSLLPEDKAFRAIKLGKKLMRQKPEVLEKKLTEAAEKKQEGIYYEYLALDKIAKKSLSEARTLFEKARDTYKEPKDKLRNILSIADLLRQQQNKPAAIALLKKTLPSYANSPESLTIKSLITILDPPPPPPAKPGNPAPPTKKKK